jgi:hypothetical protein
LRGTCLLRCLDNRATRGMCWHSIEDAGAAVTEGTANVLDLVRLAVERAAYHQEDPSRVGLRYLLGDRVRCGCAERYLLHATENDATTSCHLCSLRNSLC